MFHMVIRRFSRKRVLERACLTHSDAVVGSAWERGGMGGAGPRRVLALALALATVALAGARDVARTDVGAPSEGMGGFTRTESPRRALAQWTLPPRRAVPSPEDARLPWRTSPRAAASAAMGSDNSAPLGEEEDHHETDGIPTTTSLTTDYDELDADYFARRTESKIIDPLDRQLERWYRTADELEAPLPESRRVEAEEEREEEAKAPTETDDASPRTVGLDRGDESAAGKKPPPSETEETGANATSFVTATNASSETKHERGDKRAVGEKLGWLEAQLEEKAEKKEARSRDRNDTRVSFDAVELFYADVTDPRRPVGEAIYQGPREGGKKATDARRTAFDDALEDARFDVTTEELERDEAEYRAWAAARDSARENENDGSAETGDDAVTSEADAVVDAIVADAEALRERARKMFRRNTTSEHDEAEAQSQNEAAEAQSQNEAAEAQSQKQKVARDVAARVMRDAEDRGAKSEMAAEAIAAVASDDDSARRAIIAAAKRALEEDGVLPAGVTPEDVTRGDAESEAESAPAEKEEKRVVPVPPSNATASNATASNATASSDGNGRRIPSLGAKRSKGGSKGTGSPSGTDRDLESSMFAASTDLKHASEEEGKAKAKKASSAATSKTASTKSSSSTKRTSRTSKSSKRLSRKESLSREEKEKEKEKEKAPTGPLSASEEIDAAMAALVAAAKTDADAARAQIDASEDSGDDSAYVAAVGTVIPQHDFGEEIRATSAEVLQTQRTEERVASSRLETLVVSAVGVGVVGFGFASLRDFLLRDRESLDASARLSDVAETGPAGEGALGAVSPASLLRKQKPEDRRKSEDERDAPKAKTPTKKDIATASPRAREKTPLLPK